MRQKVNSFVNAIHRLQHTNDVVVQCRIHVHFVARGDLTRHVLRMREINQAEACVTKQSSFTQTAPSNDHVTE